MNHKVDIGSFHLCIFYTLGCLSERSREKQMPVVHNHGCGNLLIIGMKIDSCTSKYPKSSKYLLQIQSRWMNEEDTLVFSVPHRQWEHLNHFLGVYIFPFNQINLVNRVVAWPKIEKKKTKCLTDFYFCLKTLDLPYLDGTGNINGPLSYKMDIFLYWSILLETSIKIIEVYIIRSNMKQ